MQKRRVINGFSMIASGLLALLVSVFFAGGTIAENYTDETFVAPEFFIIILVWGLGALAAVFHFVKNSTAFFILSLILTWASIPLGLVIGFSIA